MRKVMGVVFLVTVLVGLANLVARVLRARLAFSEEEQEVMESLSWYAAHSNNELQILKLPSEDMRRAVCILGMFLILKNGTPPG